MLAFDCQKIKCAAAHLKRGLDKTNTHTRSLAETLTNLSQAKRDRVKSLSRGRRLVRGLCQRQR